MNVSVSSGLEAKTFQVYSGFEIFIHLDSNLLQHVVLPSLCDFTTAG